MKSGWNIGKLRKGRLVKVIALLFVLHAGVDLVFPQFCSEEAVNIAINRSSPVSIETGTDQTAALVAASSARDSSEQQPSDAPPRDEDCFCCCTHVMASRGFVNSEDSEIKLPSSSQQVLSVLSAPLKTPYHPPRFA